MVSVAFQGVVTSVVFYLLIFYKSIKQVDFWCP